MRTISLFIGCFILINLGFVSNKTKVKITNQSEVIIKGKSNVNSFECKYNSAFIEDEIQVSLAKQNAKNAWVLNDINFQGTPVTKPATYLRDILDEIVSKGLMTVDELAIFLDINEASIRKYLACSDKPKYKRAVEILFKIFDEIYKPQKHIPIPAAPYQSNYDNSDSYFNLKTG